MKKQIFIAALAIMFGTAHLKAQNKGDVEVGIGISGQASMDYDRKDNEVRHSDIESIGAGIFAEYYLSNSWGIKIKVCYDPKGWSDASAPDLSSFDPVSGDFVYVKASHPLNYLTIPVTANWHFGSNKNWYLNLGPYVGFLLEAKETTFGIDLKNTLYEDTDFGLAFGIGYKFKIKDRIKLFFEIDIQQGFKNLYKNSEGNINNFRGGLNIGALYSL